MLENTYFISQVIYIDIADKYSFSMLQCSFKNHVIFVNLFPHSSLAVLYV